MKYEERKKREKKKEREKAPVTLAHVFLENFCVPP